MNIAHGLERTARHVPDQVAVHFEARRLTYDELNRRANRLANALGGLSVSRGDCVALYLPNSPQFLVAYFACQKLGAVAVSLNVMLLHDEVRFILNDSRAVAIITHASLMRNVPQPADLPALRHVISVGATDRGREFNALLESASVSFTSVDLHPHTTAAILYTSGTTGEPKGAMLSHGNVVSNSYATAHHLSMRRGDCHLLVLPLFHCFGQNFIMNAAIVSGGALSLHQRFEADAVLRRILDDGVTMFHAVPTIYILLLNHADSGQYLHHVRYYFTAAASMPTDVARRWRERFGVIVNEGYGLTETSPLASYNHDFRFKPGSIGSPIENVEMRIVDEAGNPLGVGEVGEIAIRGPNVMQGYFNRPEETAAVMSDGWFRSGDIGQMDDEGYFFIVDRLKDMINAAGFKIWPREVEEVLFKHAAVKEAAVIGIPDAVKGEAVKAYIILKDEARASEDEIIAHCQKRIAAYKVPRHVAFVDSLPKSATGKILKKDLRLQAHERLAQGDGG